MSEREEAQKVRANQASDPNSKEVQELIDYYSARDLGYGFHGQSMDEIEAWANANGQYAPVNSEARIRWLAERGFQKKYDEDPAFRQLTKDNRGSSNIFTRVGEGFQSMAETTLDAAKGIAPTAAVMGAGALGTLAMGGAAANLGAGASLHGLGTGGSMAGVTAGSAANAGMAGVAGYGGTEAVSGAITSNASDSLFGSDLFWDIGLGGAGIWAAYEGTQGIIDATGDASDAQLQAARDAEALNRERYAEAQGYMEPYIDSSGRALNQLDIEMGLVPGEAGTAYMNTPGYLASREEAIAGIDQSAANSGNLYSGSTLAAAGEASANIHNSFYTNYMNMLQNMASPTTATNLSSFGMNQGTSIAQNNLSAQQIASGYDISGAQTNQAFLGDVIEGASNIYDSYLSKPTTPTPADPYATQGGQQPWYI